MKLDYLWVENFKNLKDLKADFDENPGELFTVLLGRNGLGKSNLLEVLVVIFRDLFLGNETEFGFELRFTLKRGETKVLVRNDPKPENTQARFVFCVVEKNQEEKNLRRDDLKTP